MAEFEIAYVMARTSMLLMLVPVLVAAFQMSMYSKPSGRFPPSVRSMSSRSGPCHCAVRLSTEVTARIAKAHSFDRSRAARAALALAAAARAVLADARARAAASSARLAAASAASA
ncbi:MAG TPA: hypothetical protein VFH03_09035 [Actinoplanes sp.]|nr:hypothetical protein [Actinoplanes sp.]